MRNRVPRAVADDETVVVGVYRMVIPRWHPTKLNDLLNCHWAVADRRKTADREQLAASAWMADIPKATGKRRVTLTIILGPRQRGGDVDCYWKSTLDALKNLRLIIDDSPKWCELAPVKYERGPAMASVVELEEIE